MNMARGHVPKEAFSREAPRNKAKVCSGPCPPPFADPDVAVRKIVAIANDVELVQDRRIHIQPVYATFLAARSSGQDFRARIEVHR